MHLISESNNEINRQCRQDISDCLISLKKTIAKENASKGLRVVEGKEQMSFQCYELTCKVFISDGTPESLFALCF